MNTGEMKRYVQGGKMVVSNKKAWKRATVVTRELCDKS
jgi:hypothetical protein